MKLAALNLLSACVVAAALTAQRKIEDFHPVKTGELLRSAEPEDVAWAAWAIAEREAEGYEKALREALVRLKQSDGRGADSAVLNVLDALMRTDGSLSVEEGDVLLAPGTGVAAKELMRRAGVDPGPRLTRADWFAGGGKADAYETAVREIRSVLRGKKALSDSLLLALPSMRRVSEALVISSPGLRPTIDLQPKRQPRVMIGVQLGAPAGFPPKVYYVRRLGGADRVVEGPRRHETRVASVGPRIGLLDVVELRLPWRELPEEPLKVESGNESPDFGGAFLSGRAQYEMRLDRLLADGWIDRNRHRRLLEGYRLRVIDERDDEDPTTDMRLPESWPVHPATQPVPSAENRGRAAGWGGGTWRDQVKAMRGLAGKHSDVDVVFFGDSITQGLTGSGDRLVRRGGKRVIDQVLADVSAVSLGLSGDRTEHLLYRIDHGALPLLAPKVIVLQIGINNINTAKHPGAEVALGIRAVVKRLREAQPQARIVICGPFPAGLTAKDRRRAQVNATHAGIRDLDDGEWVFYRDLRPLFLREDGAANDNLRRDGIHITPAGQKAWLNAIRAVVRAGLRR